HHDGDQDQDQGVLHHALATLAADHTLDLSPNKFSEMHKRHCRRTTFRSLLQSCRMSPLRNLRRNHSPTQFDRNRTRTKKTGVLPAFFLALSIMGTSRRTPKRRGATLPPRTTARPASR